ncbi:Spc98 family-domain-containing protein [Entophlyctis helioformis]|nr:Spc98 family-domain-containing protein [Entophlyctis helioformis]
MHHIDWTSAFSRLPSIFRFPDALPDPAAHHSHDRLFPTFAAAPAAEPDSAAFVETASMQSSQDSAYVSHPAEPNALDASIWESSSAFSAAPPRSLAWEHLPSSVHITDTAFSSPLVTDVPFSINDAAYRSAFQPSDRYVWADPGIVVTDRFVAKCVLKAAVGIPSAIFDLDRTDWRVAVRQDHLSRLRLASLSPSALHSILRDVACLATNHVRIRRVAHLLLDDPEHFGLTGAALASGLTQTMDRFHAYIVHLEDKLERDSLHLLEIGNAFNQPRLVLSALASLFNADSAQPFAHRSIPASLSLLSLLYDAVLRIDYLDDVQLDESGMGGIRHVLLLLLRLASAPFLAWMDAWIGLVGAHASGIDPAALYDPYGEFVGALKGPSQVDGEASSAEQRPALPAFVPSDMAKALFDAGSSLRLISDPENLKQGHFSGVPGSPLASGLHLHSRMSFRMAEIRQIHAAATAYEDAQLAIWDKESAAKVRAERRRAQDRLRQLAENVEKVRGTHLLQMHAQPCTRLTRLLSLWWKTPRRHGRWTRKRKQSAKRQFCSSRSVVGISKHPLMRFSHSVALRRRRSWSGSVCWKRQHCSASCRSRPCARISRHKRPRHLFAISRDACD